MDKITKLSEAIRLGSTLRPQCRKALFKDGGSCAIGAAIEATTGITEMEVFASIHHTIELFFARRFSVPYDVLVEATDWNDRGKTREEVADRLELMGY